MTIPELRIGGWTGTVLAWLLFSFTVLYLLTGAAIHEAVSVVRSFGRSA